MNTFTLTAVIDGVPQKFVSVRDPDTMLDGAVVAVAFLQLYAFVEAGGGEIESVEWEWSA